MKDCTTEQALLYAGAAGTAACGLMAVVDNGSVVEKIYSKDTPIVSGSVGRKAMHMHALLAAGVTAAQVLSAADKPSVKALSTAGALYAGAGLVHMGHTFHTKSIKPELGSVLAGSELLLGGAMIARAIVMHNKDKDKK